MELNDRMMALMVHSGLTKGSFAARIGVSQGVISHISSNRNKPSADMLIKILEEFENVSADWLLLGKGEMFRPKETVAISDELLKLIDEAMLLNSMNYNSLDVRLKNIKSKLDSATGSK